MAAAERSIMMAASKKILLPKQHGAWAMLLIPFLLGASRGGFSWLQIPCFIGWLLLYLSTYPLLMALKIKKNKVYISWFYRYFSGAIVLLCIPLFFHIELIYFGLAMIPFFFINVYFAKKKKDRAFMNDVAAIAVFCIGGLVSFYLGKGELTSTAFKLYTSCLLFFIGSTFYVKTMIREKKNIRFKWYSWGYHVVLIIFLIFSGYAILTLAYIPSVIRAFFLYGHSLPIKTIGVLEIINAVYFFIAMIALYSAI
jgi:hypothetical protein